ncbi:V-type ATP synthase subunit E [uncultured Oscillibacter sp.]|uniref:V-type ATP synthase subunit E n=1 Tax=uncultured Oscillibacter sp. TaxID=876091 RepID=UPI0025E9641C|nr:V-type ATP synthase subunit E [uncultured Oscillibacter sp.]
MNGIERITARIDAETQAEIDRIRENAEAEAEKIAQRYWSQAETEAADLRGRSERAAAEREERLVSSAQMDARKTALAARQEMVDKAYALALEKLCTLPDEQYIQTVAALLVQAAPDGTGEVIFSKEQRERVGSAAVALANSRLGSGKLTVSAQTRPLKGGFILSNGRVEVNCSFDTLVRLQRTETAGAVAQQLFPQT